jgi:NDP-sugar pyrophosphorylase family protein
MANHSLVSCAVILATGMGSRMNHPTLPKPLVPFFGKPLLESIIADIAKSRVHRFIIVIGLRGQLIKFFGSDYQGIPLFYATQRMQLGTADAIASALSFISNKDNILLALGDIIVRPSWYCYLSDRWRIRFGLEALLSVVPGNPLMGTNGFI